MEEKPESTLTTRPARRWYSSDHRAVARLYFFLALIAVVTGQVLSLIMRFHLVIRRRRSAGSKASGPPARPAAS